MAPKSALVELRRKLHAAAPKNASKTPLWSLVWFDDGLDGRQELPLDELLLLRTFVAPEDGGDFATRGRFQLADKRTSFWKPAAAAVEKKRVSG